MVHAAKVYDFKDAVIVSAGGDVGKLFFTV
jgi:hypothetical protein